MKQTAAHYQKAGIVVSKQPDVWRVRCFGDWTITGIENVDGDLRKLAAENYPALEVDTNEVSGFDTSGAWLVERLSQHAIAANRGFAHTDNDKRHTKLVKVVRPHMRSPSNVIAERQPLIMAWLEQFGQFVVGMGKDAVTAAFLVGASIRGPQMKVGSRGGIRFKSIINQIDHMGLRAVPVIAVMSFLIGAIIAQQGANQLKYYGEELLTVNLVGILHFREIGVLLTAIMVAGRTGSAITAEIGTMKMREEIDALQVIGLNPVGVLIFPRLVALIIVLPILTFLSDITGILGAMAVGQFYIGITPEQFLDALELGVGYQPIIVGLIKAPFMAIIIGLYASVEGLKVGGSSESLGLRTTSSVVRSIFAVIVVDGLFAVFFAAIGY